MPKPCWEIHALSTVEGSIKAESLEFTATEKYMPLWGRRRQWHRRMLNLATFHEQTKMYMYVENNYSCKTTEDWIHSSEQQTKDTKLRRLGSHRSPLGAVGRELVSAIVYVALQCDRTSVFPATLPGAFGLQTKEASRYNRTLPHTTGLPARSPSSLASQAPGIISTFPAPCSLPKLPGTKSLYWRHFFTRLHPV